MVCQSHKFYHGKREQSVILASCLERLRLAWILHRNVLGPSFIDTEIVRGKIGRHVYFWFIDLARKGMYRTLDSLLLGHHNG